MDRGPSSSLPLSEHLSPYFTYFDGLPIKSIALPFTLSDKQEPIVEQKTKKICSSRGLWFSLGWCPFIRGYLNQSGNKYLNLFDEITSLWLRDRKVRLSTKSIAQNLQTGSRAITRDTKEVSCRKLGEYACNSGCDSAGWSCDQRVSSILRSMLIDFSLGRMQSFTQDNETDLP